MVAARVSGYGIECCTSAQIINASHEVTADFKSSVAVSHLLFNRDDLELLDHAQWPPCGEASLLALRDLDSLEPAPAELDAACKLSALPETEIGVRTADANVRARLPDTELARDQVTQWVNAPDPAYLLASDTEAREPAALAANAFWSQPLSWQQTLAVASLQAIRVQSVTRRGELSEVLVELLKDSGAPGPTRRLTSSCLDPRLLREGSTWLAPVMTDDASYYEAGQAPAFIVPGWLFPASGPP